MEKGKKSPLAVVIYGFAGIGKTTLATAVIAGLDLTDYNFSRVQIEEERSRNDIKFMQQQILRDAFPAYTNGRNVTLRNSAEGQDQLTNAFHAQGNKPVFLFVDNALRAEDLRELFPRRLADLPDRSRIVLTARNLAVADMLKDAGLERREHRVDLLPRQEAIKILFRDSNPNKQLDEEEEKILQTCAGVPLVLEIVGAQLQKQNYIVYNCRQIVDALEKGKDIKTENLSQRLVHSVYTELEASTQEAFLDICCFFASWSRRNVEYIVGTDEVKTLEEAALLKSENDKVIVHDIIRAKGLSMSESNRIMNMDSWIQFVGGSKALDQIKGIRLAMEGPESESGYELDVEHIISMEKSLRVLELGRQINLSRSSQKTPKFKEVRFLRLEGDFSGLWSLTLESRERPDHLAALKVLLLEEWDKMQNLSEQVCGLRHLCKLSVCGGVSLRNLPHSFGQLSSMQELILTRCAQLEELSSSFGELRSLKHLSLAECVNLKELPSSFGKLSSLEVLNLESCWKVEVLPSSFGQLRRLKKLTLQSFIKELPSNFGELGVLEELQLCGCMELKELPVSIGQLINLTHLDLGYCMNLKTLPYSIGKLRSLRDFNLMACSKLESLPSNIWDLSFLTQIDLRRCKGLKDFSPPTQKNPGLVIWLPTN